MNAWKLDIQDGIGHLIFDVPEAKVNTFSVDTMSELDGLLDACRERSDLTALVLRSGKDHTFIAGADIKELAKINDAASAFDKAKAGQTVFQKLADLKIPTVAIIDGACLGGGFEVALACDARIAVDVDQTKIGLPETQLGIIPGWGGCVRLPRLIGLANAAGLICGGRVLDARKAFKKGLVDAIASPVDIERILTETVEALQAGGTRIKAQRKKKRGGFMTRVLLEGTPLGRAIIAKSARKQVLAKTKGHYPAPVAAIDAMTRGMSATFTHALEIEATVFSTLAPTPLCHHLVELFFTNESLKKVGGKDDGTAKAITSTGVLGAGVMGGGIAWLFANGGCDVRVKDIAWDAVAGAFRTANDYFGQMVKRRKMDKQQQRNAMARITGTIDPSGFQEASFVVEAVVEKIEIKRSVLAEIEQEVPEDCILATNTSSLLVSEMASALKRPDRFCGFHFFNPVNRMPLVEVVAGPQTSDATIATACALARRMKKTAIVVGDCPGFLVNRILLPYLNEAARLLQEGADIERVDNIMLDYGMPMGPFRLADEVGLDVGVKVAHILEDGYGERMAAAPVLDALIDQGGLLGRKGGAGLYRYNGKNITVNRDAMKTVSNWRNQVGASTHHHSDEEIRDRLILIMVNEAARCLSEGIVSDPRHLDMAMIMGTGFPAFRGGLLRDAEARGVKNIRDRLTELAEKNHVRFAPVELITEIANTGGPFHGNQDLPSAA